MANNSPSVDSCRRGCGASVVDRQPPFFSAAQADYAQMIDRDPESLLILLRETSKPFMY